MATASVFTSTALPHPEQVLFLRNRLQMVGVAARWVLAKVIQLVAVVNASNEHRPHKSMDTPVRTVVFRLTISTSRFATRPYPTVTIGIDLTPEPGAFDTWCRNHA